MADHTSLIRRLPCMMLVIAMMHHVVIAEETDVGLETLRETASAGNPDALFQLAERHERGDGLDQDLRAAAVLYRHAAERGHSVAQYRLGLALAFGIGVDKDPAESRLWLSTFLQQGDETNLLAERVLKLINEEASEGEESSALTEDAVFEPIEGPVDLDIQKVAKAEVADPDPLTKGSDQVASLIERLGETTCGPIRTTTEAGGLVTISAEAERAVPLQDAVIGDIDDDIDVQITEVEPSICATLGMLRRIAGDTTVALALRNQSGALPESFHDGDHIVIEVPPLPHPRYLTIDYYIHDGIVLHILSNTDEPDNFLPAGQQLTLGKPGDGGQEWQVSPPFGNDLIVLHASSEPLATDDRPTVENVEDYLDVLRPILSDAQHGHDVRTTYQVVRTLPK